MELYLVSLATVVALNVMLAVGLNLISGFCGQISLGHAAFYGARRLRGSACGGCGRTVRTQLCALGILVAAFAGFVVGFAALRVREDFLAIATMGVGFLFLGCRPQAGLARREIGISQIPAPPFDALWLCWRSPSRLPLQSSLSLHIGRSWMGHGLRAR
jgi:branched-chain amino acid transport system permease protein